MSEYNEVFNKLEKILYERESAYGSVFEEIGNYNINIGKLTPEKFLFIMITLKYQRIKSIINKNEIYIYQKELEDNIYDLINYSILLLQKINVKPNSMQ
jgi:hypothetical protein